MIFAKLYAHVANLASNLRLHNGTAPPIRMKNLSHSDWTSQLLAMNEELELHIRQELLDYVDKICSISKNVLDNFCQLGTNDISTFRGCLQLTAFPFRSQDCEEILPGCNLSPSGSFYRALHLSEFCSVLFSARYVFADGWLVNSQKIKKRSVSWIVNVEYHFPFSADTNPPRGTE